MKKAQKIMRDFKKLKSQLHQTENSVFHCKDSNLWNHEASVRKKIKKLRSFSNKQIKEYNDVYDEYLQLLDTISKRLLNHYNKKNGTDYEFEEVVSKDKKDI